MTSNPILPWFLEQRDIWHPGWAGFLLGCSMSSCHCFQQMHLEPSPQEPIARETFLNFHHQKEAMKLTYNMNGSTLTNSTPAILEVCIVRFGKALFHCSMERNLCHDTPSHGCRVGKQSCFQASQIKKGMSNQSHMPHGFPFCGAHESP